MSGFSASSCSSFSSSNFGPSTPYSSSSSTSSRRRPSSEGSHTLSTPPGSLRDYSASLKASHTLGMAAAMKSMPIEREPGQFGSLRHDDNPFDNLYSSPTPAPKPILRRSALGTMRQEQSWREAETVEVLETRQLEAMVEPDADIPSFKPALINFHRKVSDESNATPGSVGSEASFEGGAPEDYFRVYGRPAYSYSPIDLGAYVHDDSRSQSQSTYTPPTSDSPFEHPLSRLSVVSSATNSTITSVSSSVTITSLQSPACSPMLTAQIVGVAGTARMSRPSLLRPRPRKHPYEAGSGRQRENSGGARGMSFGQEEEDMRQDGRSVSEMMVAMAGLRCQRGRAMRG